MLPPRALKIQPTKDGNCSAKAEKDKHPQLEGGASVQSLLPLFALFEPFGQAAHVAAELSSHGVMVT